MIKNFGIKTIFSVSIFTCLALWGCMESPKLSPVEGNKMTLNNRHLGWGTADCLACHPKSNLFATPEASAVHSMLDKGGGNIDFESSACSSCHGSNGTAINNANLGNCTLCHSDNSSIIPLNKRFYPAHTKITDLTLPSVDCRSCHIVTNHPEKNTTLAIMDNSVCLECHTDHGAGFVCSSCHNQEGGRFERDRNGNITRHRVSFPNE